MLKFIVRLPGGKDTAFYAQEDDVFIGRVSSINDICIDDRSISRQHAHVKKREEGYTIYDLRSLNGVLLNGTRVSRAVLKDGDEIQLGSVIIKVHTNRPTEDEQLRAIEQSEQTAVAYPDDENEVTGRTNVEHLRRVAKRRKGSRKRKK